MLEHQADFVRFKHLQPPLGTLQSQRPLAGPCEARAEPHRPVKQPGVITVLEDGSDSLDCVADRYRPPAMGDLVP